MIRQPVSGTSAVAKTERPESEAQQKKTQADGYWIDPKASLMWAAKNRDKDMSQSEAIAYCEASSVGGFTNWRLPAIEELAGLYHSDPPYWQTEPHPKPYRMAGGILLTYPHQIASSTYEGSGYWFFDFMTHSAGRGGIQFPLCVRNE